MLINAGALDQFGIAIPSKIVDLILFILTIVLFVGVPEEILFRGYVQKSFESKLSTNAAVFLTAVFFSLFHIIFFITLPPIFMYLFIPYFGISLLIGIVAKWRGNLYAAIVMHIVYDITQFIIIYSLIN